MVAAFVAKEKSCGVVLLHLRNERYSWVLVQHTASWWCTDYTKLFCNYRLLMITNNWRALLV